MISRSQRNSQRTTEKNKEKYLKSSGIRIPATCSALQ